MKQSSNTSVTLCISKNLSAASFLNYVYELVTMQQEHDVSL